MIINLYDEICDKLPFSAGLNPKEFRFCFRNFLYLYFLCFSRNNKKSQNEYIRAKKNIIDLQLLSVYAYLTISLQKKISTNLGTTREYLLSIILHLFSLC